MGTMEALYQFTRLPVSELGLLLSSVGFIVMADLEPIHQEDQSRFVIAVGGSEAVLEYKLSGAQVDFCRTFVPQEGRGSGVAERLVHAGLAWAKQQSLKVKASCWYVDKFLK